MPARSLLLGPSVSAAAAAVPDLLELVLHVARELDQLRVRGGDEHRGEAFRERAGEFARPGLLPCEVVILARVLREVEGVQGPAPRSAATSLAMTFRPPM